MEPRVPDMQFPVQPVAAGSRPRLRAGGPLREAQIRFLPHRDYTSGTIGQYGPGVASAFMHAGRNLAGAVEVVGYADL